MTISNPKLTLKAGRDWSVRRGHPWLFSGGLQNPPKNLQPGAVVDLQSAEGEFLARGYYNPKTDIAVRILTTDPNEAIDQSFFERRLARTLQLRQDTVNLEHTNAYRLVNAEGDWLPGLIIDSYAGALVVQSHTAGIDQQLEPIIAALQAVVKPAGILLRNDVAVRTREGLAREEARLVAGAIAPEIIIQENGLNFAVDLWKGQKTGFFADQRDKRAALQRYIKPAKTLLNCFSYTAGFSVYAAKANPDLIITSVDQSAPALEIGKRNFSLNQLDSDKHQFLAVDAFAFLPSEKEQNHRYDAVILDPPAFAKTNRGKDKALRGYTNLNTAGLALVAEDGLLVTCSCTGAVSMDEFEGAVTQAAMQAKRHIQLLEVFEHGSDHPTNLAAPESRYLKVFFCRVF